DLAVLDDRDVAVLVRDRLMAAREVDDREAAHAHGKRAVDQETLVVGTTMLDHVAHRLRDRAGREDPLLESEKTGNAAHSLGDPSWFRPLVALPGGPGSRLVNGPRRATTGARHGADRRRRRASCESRARSRRGR